MKWRVTLAVPTVILALVAPAAAAVSYETDFNLTESPISEGGSWSSADLQSTRVATANGIAFGTQTGTGGLDDSYAHLSGFPPDQSASGVVHLDPAISHNTTHEVEILLRIKDAPNSLSGYECNFAYDGTYCQIVRLDSGSFTYLAGPGAGQGNVPGGLHEGDVVSAQIIGNAITSYVNGVRVATATDSTYATGNPGIGFFLGAPSTPNSFYAFTRYTANSLPAAVPVPFRWVVGLALALLAVGIAVQRRWGRMASRPSDRAASALLC
jgi:hypothetical protein